MNSKNVSYMIIGIQLIGISLVAYSINAPEQSMISKIAVKLPIMTGIIIATGVVLTFLLFKTTYTKTTNDTTLYITKQNNIIYEMFDTKYDKCPKFINSLKYSFNKHPYNTQNQENEITIYCIGMQIFQFIDDYLTIVQNTLTSDARMIAVFLEFCQSKKLKELWTKNYFGYNKKTQQLINILFNITENINFSTPEQVVKFSEQFIFSKQYENILNYNDETIKIIM